MVQLCQEMINRDSEGRGRLGRRRSVRDEVGGQDSCAGRQEGLRREDAAEQGVGQLGETSLVKDGTTGLEKLVRTSVAPGHDVVSCDVKGEERRFAVGRLLQEVIPYRQQAPPPGFRVAALADLDPQEHPAEPGTEPRALLTQGAVSLLQADDQTPLERTVVGQGHADEIVERRQAGPPGVAAAAGLEDGL